MGKKFSSGLPKRLNLNRPLLPPKQRSTSQIIVTITLIITATIPAHHLSPYPSPPIIAQPGLANSSSHLLGTCYVVSILIANLRTKEFGLYPECYGKLLDGFEQYDSENQENW